MVLAVARKNPQFAQSLLAMIDKEVNRDTDKNALQISLLNFKNLSIKQIINYKNTIVLYIFFIVVTIIF